MLMLTSSVYVASSFYLNTDLCPRNLDSKTRVKLACDVVITVIQLG